MKTVRCVKCDRKLGLLDGKAEIKCPRCNTLNKLETKQESVK